MSPDPVTVKFPFTGNEEFRCLAPKNIPGRFRSHIDVQPLHTVHRTTQNIVHRTTQNIEHSTPYDREHRIEDVDLKTYKYLT